MVDPVDTRHWAEVFARGAVIDRRRSHTVLSIFGTVERRLRASPQDVARQITRLLEFVSLNMRGVRKILKKFAKNVDPTPPAPGFVALEIQHPHDPNWKLLQVPSYLKVCCQPLTRGLSEDWRWFVVLIDTIPGKQSCCIHNSATATTTTD